jgi:hypothetical protein
MMSIRVHHHGGVVVWTVAGSQTGSAVVATSIFRRGIVDFDNGPSTLRNKGKVKARTWWARTFQTMFDGKLVAAAKNTVGKVCECLRSPV